MNQDNLAVASKFIFKPIFLSGAQDVETCERLFDTFGSRAKQLKSPKTVLDALKSRGRVC